jgi:hypothetical protein
LRSNNMALRRPAGGRASLQRSRIRFFADSERGPPTGSKPTFRFAGGAGRPSSAKFRIAEHDSDDFCSAQENVGEFWNCFSIRATRASGSAAAFGR